MIDPRLVESAPRHVAQSLRAAFVSIGLDDSGEVGCERVGYADRDPFHTHPLLREIGETISWNQDAGLL